MKQGSLALCKKYEDFHFFVDIFAFFAYFNKHRFLDDFFMPFLLKKDVFQFFHSVSLRVIY